MNESDDIIVEEQPAPPKKINDFFGNFECGYLEPSKESVARQAELLLTVPEEVEAADNVAKAEDGDATDAGEENDEHCHPDPVFEKEKLKR